MCRFLSEINYIFATDLENVMIMIDKLNTYRNLIHEGNVDSAIQALLVYIEQDWPQKDEAFYLLGNAYRKQGHWQQAIENYLSATAINPKSPAAQAYEMMIDILNFYNKDMYNQ